MRWVSGFLLLALVCAQTADVAEARKRKDREAIVTLLGEDLSVRDLLSRRERRKYRDRHMALAAKALREKALNALVARRLPDCRLQASEEEVTRYITWWRAAWTESRLAAARNLRAVLDQAPKAPGATASPGGSGSGRDESRGTPPAQNINPKLIDHLIRARHKPEEITTGNKKAVQVAEGELETWLGFKCIQAAYGGRVFHVLHSDLQEFSLSQPGAGGPGTPLVSFRMVDGFPLPAEPALTQPTGSLVAFFEAAEAEGQLVFKKPELRKQFFARQRTGNELPGEEGARRLQAPHWMPQNTPETEE